MSNIFTYEIDERNLRIQLKSLEVPVKAEAWQKFEIYAKANPFQQQKSSFKSFELNLSRNVVLPAVFGLIIILFSFLLFNFITIKNPSASATLVTPPAEEQTETPIKSKNITVAQESNTKQVQLIPAQLAPVEKSVPEKIVSGAPVTSEISPAAPALTESEIAEKILEQSKHKRKRNAEAEALSRIQPTIVEDVNEPSEIPN